MTTNEILAAARRKILETGTELVADTTLLVYANEAYREVYKRLFQNKDIVKVSISCAAGVCTLPATYGRMYGPARDNDGNVYQEYSVADYDNGNFDFGFTVSAGSMKVSRTDISSITIEYYPVPATLTAFQDPTIDPYFHECIVYGIIWRAQEDLQDEELATYYQTKFESELQRRVSNQSAYDESNQRGSELFTFKQLI